jgi:hypothetical protein
MARSKKTSFRKKTQRKVKRTRKQKGGENELTWPLDEGDRVFPDGNYKEHKILWTEEPINIPGFEGTYIGEYYLDKNGDAIMHGRGRFVSSEKNPKNGMYTIYDGTWNSNKKNGLVQFEYMNGDNGEAEFQHDRLLKPNEWHYFAPTYNYADGRVYEGELILKNGRAVPLDYDEVPSRTVFNFAPGPDKFLNFKGDYVQLDKREAERGFRMSQDPNFVPPVPPNSPQRESVVVRRGPGLKSRLSGIRDSRLTAVESGPLDRAEELRQMRELAASQTGLKSLSRVSALPPIKTTRKGGKYRKRGKKTKRRR